MAEPAQPLHGHKISCSRPAMAQTIERRNARAENGSRLCRRERVRNGSQGLAPCNHVVRIPAIITESRDSEILATDEIPTTTGDTLTAVPAVPSHPHPLALLPRRHARSDRVDHPGHLVPRDARVLQPGPMSFLHKQVTMTDPTGLHSDADCIGPRSRDLSRDNFEWRARTTNLHRGHLCHERASFVREQKWRQATF